jgi:hypothetical protein
MVLNGCPHFADEMLPPISRNISRNLKFTKSQPSCSISTSGTFGMTSFWRQNHEEEDKMSDLDKNLSKRR